MVEHYLDTVGVTGSEPCIAHHFFIFCVHQRFSCAEFFRLLATVAAGGIFPTMETTLVKSRDDKGRVSIRGTRKGGKYLVTAESGSWWVMPAPKFTVPEKIESPAGTRELRAAALESFYDKSKAW